MSEVIKSRKINLVYYLLVLVFFIAGYFIGGYRGAKIYERTVKERIVGEISLPNLHHLEILRNITEMADPVRYIKDDLIKRTDLIPEEPVLGGTMGFYNRDDIHLITDKWVLAGFEDGHIGGYLLLEFNIQNENNIEWKVVKADLD